jgi:hypothetical protein
LRPDIRLSSTRDLKILQTLFFRARNQVSDQRNHRLERTATANVRSLFEVRPVLALAADRPQLHWTLPAVTKQKSVGWLLTKTLAKRNGS